MAVSNQQSHALITYFLGKYRARYDKDPRDFNRHRDKWGFAAMIEQYGTPRSKEIIDYYFETRRPGHPVNYLLFNYDKLHQIMTEKAEDDEKRRQLRMESMKRVEAWRSGKQ